jgi:hypothetical protein
MAMTKSRFQLHRLSTVQAMWTSYRTGTLVLCPEDNSPMAIAIDGVAKAYRFLCTASGLSTPWFSVREDQTVVLHLMGDEAGFEEDTDTPTA